MSALPRQITVASTPALDGHVDPVRTAKRLALDFSKTAEAHDRSGVVNRDNLRVLRETGLTSLTVPADFGGPDVRFATLVEVIGEIGKADPATALILTMQLFHTRAVALSVTWPVAVRARVLRSIVREGALINALRVEPELGSPVRGGLPASSARRTEKGWEFSGRKRYSTGSSELTWGIVWGAAYEHATPQVGEFLLPIRARGVRFEDTWDHLGLRASDSLSLIHI